MSKGMEVGIRIFSRERLRGQAGDHLRCCPVTRSWLCLGTSVPSGQPGFY